MQQSGKQAALLMDMPAEVSNGAKISGISLFMEGSVTNGGWVVKQTN